MTKDQASSVAEKLTAYFGERKIDILSWFDNELRYWNYDQAIRAVDLLRTDTNRRKYMPNLAEMSEYYKKAIRREPVKVDTDGRCDRCDNTGFIPFEKRELSYNPVTDTEFSVWRVYSGRCNCGRGHRKYRGIKFYDGVDLNGVDCRAWQFDPFPQYTNREGR